MLKQCVIIGACLVLSACTASAQADPDFLSLNRAEIMNRDIRPSPVPAAMITAVQPPVPDTVEIAVPFSSQAPHGVWDAYYNETCEEMSLLMVLAHMYDLTFDIESVDASLRDMTDWQAEHGYGESIAVADLAAMAQQRFGVEATIITDVRIASIEELLRAGYPVIVPAAGRRLENPYFSGGGPWYHMLVITGYDADSFITNDPGTAAGEGYRYPKELLLSAIHDWTGVPERIEEGSKAMLILDVPAPR